MRVPVFVIGFGTAMPPIRNTSTGWPLRKTTSNSANAGNPAAYSIATGCHATDNPRSLLQSDLVRLLSIGGDRLRTDSSALTETCYGRTKPIRTAGNTIRAFVHPPMIPVPGSFGVRLSRRRCGSTGRGRESGHHHHPRPPTPLPVVDPVIGGPQTRTTSTRAHSSRSRGDPFWQWTFAAVQHQ